MKRLYFILPLTVCACASVGTTSEQVAKQPAVFQSKETGVVLGERPRASSMSITAAPNVAAVAVRTIYKQFEIPIPTDDPKTHQIGNNQFHRTRTFAGQPMTEWLNCGSTMTGPNAASYRIYLSVLTDVVPDGHGGTNLHTLVVASAQDMAGSSNDAVTCGSTGKFEAMFLERVVNLIGK